MNKPEIEIDKDMLKIDLDLHLILTKYYKNCIEFGLGKDDIETRLMEIIDEATEGEIELSR